MEMRLDHLDIDQLPNAEKAFIGLLLKSSSFILSAGSVGENVMQHVYRGQFGELDQYSNIALARIGSGGRYDGAGVGDQEFVLITRPAMVESDLPDENFISLLKQLELPIERGLDSSSSVSAEHKSLSDCDDALLFHPNRPGHPYPGRILEAEYVAGNFELLEEAKLRTLTAIKNKPRYIKKMNKELKDYRLTCETGVTKFKGRVTQQFSSDQQYVEYDPNQGVYGFKYGFLRFYQLALTIEIFEYMIRANLDPEDLIDLNPGVEERIRYLLRKRWIADEDVAIIHGYNYVKISELQAGLKIRYFINQKPNERKLVHEFVSRDFLNSMSDAIKQFPRGKFLR